MLIRITQHTAGIEEYLETGKKAGRKESRDELDKRVCLDGDLQTLSWATQYTRKNKNWKNHYWHITASFALENNDLDDDTLRAISQEMLDYYYCAYDREKLIYAVEAHRPKVQSIVDKSTGDLNQRLLHMHLVVSKYDIETDNQIRMIPFKESADREFQSTLCRKYHLIDPQTRKRHTPKTKKDMIARWKGDAKTSKQTQVAQARKHFSMLLKEVQSLDEAFNTLYDTGLVKDIQSKQHKSGTIYLQVKLRDTSTRNINLRGKGFENLEKLYTKGPIEVKATSAEGAWKKHKTWWLKEQNKAPKRLVNYKKVEEDYDKYFEAYTPEQRYYFVIYRNNISLELIQDYHIYRKVNETKLINNDLDVKLYDQGDKIVLELPDDDIARRKAIRLALAIAMDKGWDLKDIDINGSDRFQQEVREEIAHILQNKEASLSKNQYIPPKKGEVKKIGLNIIDQSIADLKEKLQKQKLTKEEIKTLKLVVKADLVLRYAMEKYRVMGKHYVVTPDNKIKDTRTTKRPVTVIDFLVKTCNVRFSDALVELSGLYKYQKANSPELGRGLDI